MVPATRASYQTLHRLERNSTHYVLQILFFILLTLVKAKCREILSLE